MFVWRRLNPLRPLLHNLSIPRGFCWLNSDPARHRNSQQRQHVDGHFNGHLNGHVNGYRDGRNNGYTDDRFTDQASQRRPRQAFSSAADVAEEDWEALILDQEAEGEGGQGTEKEPLSYGTLWKMQLEREEQSHQEACDKYSKVINV